MSLLLDIRVGFSLREGFWKQAYLLPASQQHQSSSAPLRHKVGSQGFCPALSFSYQHPNESCGKDLENGYLGPLCRRFPGVLNSHVNSHSPLKNLSTFHCLHSCSSACYLSLYSLLKEDCIPPLLGWAPYPLEFSSSDWMTIWDLWWAFKKLRFSRLSRFLIIVGVEFSEAVYDLGGSRLIFLPLLATTILDPLSLPDFSL